MTDKTLQEYAREYLKVKAEYDKAKARKEELAAKFHAELGNGKTQFGLYTVTTWESTRPNVKAAAIKELYPDIYEEYGHDTLVPGIRVTKAEA